MGEALVGEIVHRQLPFEPLGHHAGRGLERWHALLEALEDRRAEAPVGRDRRGRHVEPDGGHSATDVAANGGRVDQAAGGERDTDTHLPRAVHVGHHRHLADVRGLREPIERADDVGRERAGEPAVYRHASGWESVGQRGSSPPSPGAVARYSKRSDGARFRVIACATSPRSHGVRAWRWARTSVGGGGSSPGAEPTITRSWEASGAGTTRTT